MNQKIPLLLIFSSMLLLTPNNTVTGIKHCPNCGHIPVPYPLSTGLDCGDQSYKIRCTTATLWLDALNGSSYLITSINAFSQRLIIRPPELKPNTCISPDLKSHGIVLDDNLPFNISSSNTVLLMNCTNDILQRAEVNCSTSTSSICPRYIATIKQTCRGGASSCCWFKTGGSVSAYRIIVRPDWCSAYTSFVNLNVELPVSKWPEPGVEIGWSTPQGQLCKLQVECDRDLENSVCLKDSDHVGQSRCFCKTGFRWDSINGICQRNASAAATTTGLKCIHKGGCKHKKSKAPIIAATAGGAIVIIVAITIVLVYKKKQPATTKAENSLILIRANDSGRLSRIFPGREITKATNNFSPDTLLGSGGFGDVYKGVCQDGTIVAIKRAKPGNTKAIDQILNEVRILCQVNHKSLVKLLGCCIELEQPLLIYEYVPNGTLFDRLYNVQSGIWAPLTWRQRLHIAYQAADALYYLHSAASPPIYHCDVKSSNVLINANTDAKVSDFGLSRLAVSNASYITTSAQGTLGYLDPEYYLNSRLTDKSDVYSFGVVLMELLTCMKAIDFNREQDNVNLVVYVKKMFKGDRLMDVIDPAINEGASRAEFESMKAFGTLALACLDESRRNRPSMKQVVNQIEKIASVFPGEISES